MARGRSSKHKIPADPINTSFDKFEDEVRQGNPLVLDALDHFSKPACFICELYYEMIIAG
ncbi:hypothetical protein K435DRAFT_871368 [Dendrothele bispora CBS 962.96]|uniref:Uncharacterized protein n=1 Tax=Dendrothele bispora (strain CBS 962.96) TaxID=1314807 RepID=A0A4V4HCH0_DENBC|nr:hypothetical protein K435DRAFT_871368 [Dendrothele bispora CBS 962.96]